MAVKNCIISYENKGNKIEHWIIVALCLFVRLHKNRILVSGIISVSVTEVMAVIF